MSALVLLGHKAVYSIKFVLAVAEPCPACRNQGITRHARRRLNIMVLSLRWVNSHTCRAILSVSTVSHFITILLTLKNGSVVKII